MVLNRFHANTTLCLLIFPDFILSFTLCHRKHRLLMNLIALFLMYLTKGAEDSISQLGLLFFKLNHFGKFFQKKTNCESRIWPSEASVPFISNDSNLPKLNLSSALFNRWRCLWRVASCPRWPPTPWPPTWNKLHTTGAKILPGSMCTRMCTRLYGLVLLPCYSASASSPCCACSSTSAVRAKCL